MKNTIAIFAHYDKHNKIDDYVVIYLKILKEVVDEIIFVSDCDIEEAELLKINHLILDSICKKHGEYDFGSYKKGFFLLQNKYSEKFANLEKLVFANDSCYCVGSFSEAFKKINEDESFDCFGLTDSYEKSYHLQSYFLVFRKSVFHQNFFQEFLENVKNLNEKREIIYQYEIGLSDLLARNNKKIKAIYGFENIKLFLKNGKTAITQDISYFIKNYKYLISANKIYKNLENTKAEHGFCYNDGFYLLLKNGYPLVKTRLISNFYFSKKKTNVVISYFWQDVLKNYDDFMISIIKNHGSRVNKSFKKNSDLIYKILKIKTPFILALILAGFIIF